MFKSIIRKWGLAITIATGCLSVNSAHAYLYSLDDGIADGILGTSMARDILWMNGFEAQAGNNLITTIQAQWGSTILNGSGADLAVSVLLFDDPTNDGNPADAILLTSLMTTAMEYATGNWIDIAITPTLVTGNFFVGALLRDAPDGGTWMAPLDRTSPAGSSWVLSEVGGATSINLSDLSGIKNLPEGVNPATDANFMLRAIGISPTTVPEPSTLLLMGLGMAGLGFTNRKKHFPAA